MKTKKPIEKTLEATVGCKVCSFEKEGYCQHSYGKYCPFSEKLTANSENPRE